MNGRAIASIRNGVPERGFDIGLPISSVFHPDGTFDNTLLSMKALFRTCFGLKQELDD